MYFVLTDWHKKNKNDWVALELETNTFIGCADTLAELDAKYHGEGVTYAKNWMGQYHDCPNEEII